MNPPTTRAYRLLQSIQRLGDIATHHNLGLTPDKIDDIKLIEYMTLNGWMRLDRSVRPNVYRVNEGLIDRALGLDRIPTIDEINRFRDTPIRAIAPLPQPKPKKTAKKPAKKAAKKPSQPSRGTTKVTKKWRRPLKSAYCSELPGLIKQMLSIHGELCVARQLVPLLEAAGGNFSESQVTAALHSLMDQGEVSRRISYRKVHGNCGAWAYTLVKTGARAA